MRICDAIRCLLGEETALEADLTHQRDLIAAERDRLQSAAIAAWDRCERAVKGIRPHGLHETTPRNAGTRK